MSRDGDGWGVDGTGLVLTRLGALVGTGDNIDAGFGGGVNASAPGRLDGSKALNIFSDIWLNSSRISRIRFNPR